MTKISKYCIIKMYGYKYVRGVSFMKNKNEDKIVFEEYGIEFTDDDFKGVEKEALIECKKKLTELLKKIENK